MSKSWQLRSEPVLEDWDLLQDAEDCFILLPRFLLNFPLTALVHYEEPDCCLIYSSPPPSASPSVSVFCLGFHTHSLGRFLLLSPLSIFFIFLFYGRQPTRHRLICTLCPLCFNCTANICQIVLAFCKLVQGPVL